MTTTTTAVGSIEIAKGQQHKANTVDANLDVSVLQQLVLGHHSDNDGGNVVMLVGRWHNES